MICLTCILEEPSAKEMLKSILPRILPEDVIFRFVIFEGKQDLEKQLEKRLRGWNRPDTFFMIMRDQDGVDCYMIKDGLKEKVNRSGKGDRSLVRIACNELESFYLGDLRAVEMGLGIKNLSKQQGKRKYRSPDRLGNPVQELCRLTGNSYQKIQGSRNISEYMKLDHTNTSHSFNVLINGIL